MKNPIEKGIALYCSRRGQLVVKSVSEQTQTFIVENEHGAYTQRFFDIGRIVFFDRENMSGELKDLALNEKYLYFFGDDKKFLELYEKNKEQRETKEKDKRQRKIAHDIVDQAKQKLAEKKIADETNLLKLFDEESQAIEEKDRFNTTQVVLDDKIDFCDIEREEAKEQGDKKASYARDDYDKADLRYYRKMQDKYQQEGDRWREIKKEPYFARMDYVDDEKKINKLYIGKVYDGDMNVISWHSPVAERYYLKSETQFKFNEYQYDLILRRALKVKDEKLVDFKDEYINLHDKVDNKHLKGKELITISDPFLKDILKERKNLTGFKDIIQTIQEAQYKIIKSPAKDQIVIQGCAGSGKTMILLHKISYMLYNNNDIDRSHFLILAPSDSFNLFINELSKTLELERIQKNKTFGYYEKMLKQAEIFEKKSVDFVHYKDQKLLEYVFSKQYVDDMSVFIKNEIGKFQQILRENKDYEEIIEMSKKYIAKIEQINDLYQNVASETSFGIKLRKVYWETKTIIEYMQLLKTKRDNCQTAFDRNYFEGVNAFSKLNDSINALLAKSMEFDLLIDTVGEFSKINNFKIQTVASNYRYKIDRTIQQIADCEKKLKQNKNALQELYLKQQIEKQQQILKEQNKNIEKLNKIVENVEKINQYRFKDLTIVNSAVTEINKICKDFNYKDLPMGADIAVKDFLLDLSYVTDLIKLYDILEEVKSYYRKDKPIIQKYKMNEEVVSRIKIFGNLETLLVYIFEKFGREKNLPIKRSLMTGKFNQTDVYMLLWILTLFGYKSIRNYAYIYIDEAQDLSEQEYILLRILNPYAKFCYFGDIKQNITKYRGLTDWKQLNNSNVIEEKIEQNYRNTNQIIEYCNNNLSIQMLPVGVEGDPVKEISINDISDWAKNVQDKKGIKVIIAKDKEKYYKLLKDKIPYLNMLCENTITEADKINIMDVYDSKGLEFSNVIVVDKDLTENEKYIAFTRALDCLTIAK